MKRQARLSLFFERETVVLNQVMQNVKGFAGLYFGARLLKLKQQKAIKHFFYGAPSKLQGVDGVWKLDAWPIPTDFLDVLILEHPLDLNTDFGVFIKEVLRTLRKDGTLIITGFNKVRLCSWPVQNTFGQEVACPIKRISPLKLSSMLNEAGFMTEVQYFDFCRFKILNKVFSKITPFLGLGFIIVAERKTIDLKPLEELSWAFDSQKFLEPTPLRGEYQKYDQSKD